MLDTDAIDTKQSLGQQSRLLKIDVSHFRGDAHTDSYGWGGCEVTDTAPPLWIADQVRNDARGQRSLNRADTAMSQHDGPSALWIDESLMNLYEILGFQPEGVATLSFSSR